MRPPLINRSPDLSRLAEEGYEVAVQSGHLVIHNVPYVSTQREVRRGNLVATLTLAGDVTAKPSTHVAMLAGDYPCDEHGRPLEKIRHSSLRMDLGDGLVVDHSFSSKPSPEGYPDYYEMMATYVAILSAPAQAIDPTVTAQTCAVIDMPETDGIFRYFDANTSRAGLGALVKRFDGHKLAIIGLGGTGSYILDLVAKTPVSEIHLFDGDELLTHNAFRAPGAASLDELRERPRKADHWAKIYGKMHRGVVPHPEKLDVLNVAMLAAMDFVFIAIDDGAAKRLIVEKLEELDRPFIDVGIGVQVVGDQLLGLVRVTASKPGRRCHVHEAQRISFAAGDNDAAYAKNIQIADLNALNACLAVIKWKKLIGFYVDLEKELFSTYEIDGNNIINEDEE